MTSSADESDSEVVDWLDNLIKSNASDKAIIFEFKHPDMLYFTREEDAIAFKLKFGL